MAPLGYFVCAVAITVLVACAFVIWAILSPHVFTRLKRFPGCDRAVERKSVDENEEEDPEKARAFFRWWFHPEVRLAMLSPGSVLVQIELPKANDQELEEEMEIIFF